MKVLIVIPARYPSTRYPGKPLVGLRGATGQSRSLIQRTWEAGMAVKSADRVVVATDDDRVREAAEGFGAEVVLTSDKARNGTERCSEALSVLGGGYDIIVNLQGDAPLPPPWFIEELVSQLDTHPTAEVATPVLRCDGRALKDFLSDRKEGRVGGTTAVFTRDRRALYFSKEVIPYTSEDYGDDDPTPVFHHVGVYAYKPSALASYPLLKMGPLEQLEGLEQLRFLEHEHPMLCVQVEARGHKFWELNNPSDVARIEAMLKAMGVE